MTTIEPSGHNPIQLNQLLKLLNLAVSGGDANQAIVSVLVKVNGKIVLQKRKKLFASMKIQNTS